ncbi:hypothetical protein [Massilia sp. BJB1822]|uniref:hypothetical protein n=1 Tax=Massilia sp. BJB1822 TaxID=2744470 RepID=UPI001593CC62|nr:hypothetical protein [Massilia sp. BJB1822]NVD99357.1 hypothetical protein [Massilia sp. BJB1822]
MTRLWKTVLLAQVLLYGVLGLWALSYAPRSLDRTVAARTGFTLEAPGAQGQRRISALSPTSSLYAAGIRSGDFLTYQRSADQDRFFGQEEKIGLLWTSATGLTHPVLLQPLPLSEQELQVRRVDYIVFWLTGFITLGAGLLIGLQRADSRSMRAFAQVMLAWNPWLFAFYLPASAAQTLFSHLHALYGASSYILFLYFALTYPGDAPLSGRPWALRLFIATFAGEAFIQGFGLAQGLGWIEPANWLPHIPIRFLMAMTIAATSVWILGLSWRRSAGVQRERLGWVVLSMGIAYTCYLLGNLEGLMGWTPVWMGSIRHTIVLIAHIALIYGILRHRILDFGLAVNRALVYTIISSILLVVFGVTEFAVDKLLHFQSRQQNIALDALVALAVILSFHRIQHFVNHRVDHTFFHHWHEAAQRMRNFVARAAHFTDPGILQSRFVQAVDEFGEAIGCAIYLGQDNGEFLLSQASLPRSPPQLGKDHELLVELRLHHDLVRIGECGMSQYGDLAIPMILRDRLAGVLLVGARRSGKLYRPDQVEELRHSTHRIGLHLESLRVHALEEENAAMQAKQTAMALECLQLQLENANLRLSMRSMDKHSS